MADDKSTSPRIETPAIRRDRRETMMVEHFDHLTLELRSLATTATTIEKARRIRDRYARSIGVRAGVGGDILIEYLASAEAAAADIEDIDALFMSLDVPGADVFALATAASDAARAIARARRAGP
jgi:hypothetical protein